MKNLKSHHHVAIVSLLLFGVVSIWTWGTVVFAGTTGTAVEVWVGPPDSCPNIPGYQTTVPSSMLVDGDGNCYTPPPPPVDMCANITGDQETIPAGYFRDDSGNCQPQPTLPLDVCPNLNSLQSSVPEGYINTDDGNCIKPPADMCANIPGTQILVPDELQRADNGDCFTPAAPGTTTTPTAPDEKNNSPWVAPEKPRQPSVNGASVDLKNVPAVLDPFVAPLVDAIPETIKEALRSLPPAVAQTFPYFTFTVLGTSAVLMGLQTAKEVRATRRIAKLTEREKAVAEEKDNFIALASHYLTSPLTLIERALELSRSANKAGSVLRKELQSLSHDINVILNDVEANTALKGIVAPVKDVNKHHFMTSAFFWIPILITIVIVFMSNFLLGVVGDVELGAFNLLAQAGVYVGVSAVFYSAIRSRFIQRHERDFRERLLRHEEMIDVARNEFITRSTFLLANGLGRIAGQRHTVTGEKPSAMFEEGYSQFVHLLQKFNMLSEIQAGVVGAAEHFDVKSAIDEITIFYHPQLAAKNLKLVNNLEPLAINQRRSLFTFVLSSLIDNAIKFSSEGSTITIGLTPHEHSLTVKVSDHGVAIPEEKMSSLFKPFSRSTSALEFNYEGLGFSLFLDKIIMDYVGGSIVATSADHHNTTFSVTTPL